MEQSRGTLAGTVMEYLRWDGMGWVIWTRDGQIVFFRYVV